jgi:hypothetical protein
MRDLRETLCHFHPYVVEHRNSFLRAEVNTDKLIDFHLVYTVGSGIVTLASVPYVHMVIHDEATATATERAIHRLIRLLMGLQPLGPGELANLYVSALARESLMERRLITLERNVSSMTINVERTMERYENQLQTLTQQVKQQADELCLCSAHCKRASEKLATACTSTPQDQWAWYNEQNGQQFNATTDINHSSFDSPDDSTTHNEFDTDSFFQQEQNYYSGL